MTLVGEIRPAAKGVRTEEGHVSLVDDVGWKTTDWALYIVGSWTGKEGEGLPHSEWGR